MNKAMGQVDQVTQRNASAAEEMSSAAEELSSQSEALLQLMAFFRTDGAPEEPSFVPRKASTQVRASGSWQPNTARWAAHLAPPRTGFENGLAREEFGKGHDAGI